MKVTLIEICRVDDKKASYYIRNNQEQGMEILEYKGKYFTYTTTFNYYRKPKSEFSKDYNGEWILEFDRAYRIN